MSARPTITGGIEHSQCVQGQELDSHMCSICTKIKKEPTALPCQHSFCRECIGRWTISKEHPTCPMCRAPYQGHGNFRTVQMEETKQPLIYCRKACGWSGSMASEDLHFKHECELGPKITGPKITPPTANQCAICCNANVDICITCSVEVDPEPCLPVKLSCGHEYHTHCIMRWCRTRKYCPMDEIPITFQ